LFEGNVVSVVPAGTAAPSAQVYLQLMKIRIQIWIELMVLQDRTGTTPHTQLLNW
jgi:hypothetical protein